MGLGRPSDHNVRKQLVLFCSHTLQLQCMHVGSPHTSHGQMTTAAGLQSSKHETSMGDMASAPYPLWILDEPGSLA